MLREEIRSRIGQGVVAGLLALALAAAAGERAGLLALPRPEGQGSWLASRAAGITAYVALTGVMALGLALSTGLADRLLPRARSVELHRFLSAGTLALVAGHAFALLGDGHVRFDALDVLVPFLSRHRPLAVGLGVLGGWALLAIHVSFGLQKRLGRGVWRALHYASFAVFVAATAHGVLAGTDSGALGMRALYLGASGLIVALTLARVLGAGRRPAASRLRTPG